MTDSDGQDVLEEEDEPVAEEEAHSLQVDGRPRHQLPGLMAIVEPERKTHEVRIEALAQVHLDSERLLPRDQPPCGHEDRAQRAEADDRPDEDPELAGVARRDRVVDRVCGDPDERDLRTLRGDCEDRRDDERDLVGTQEAEQTGECHSIRRSALLLHP